MRIFLVRHGETNENEKGVLQGWLPGNLSNLGKEQAKYLAERLKEFNIDYIYTSDLKRAYDTAKIISKSHPKSIIVKDSLLRERNCGSFEGKKVNSLDWDKLSGTKYTNRPEGGENFKEVHLRLKNFYQNLKNKHSSETILVIGHGGSLTMLRGVIQKIPFKKCFDLKRLENTSITEFEINAQGLAKEIRVNCKKHLEDNKEYLIYATNPFQGMIGNLKEVKGITHNLATKGNAFYVLTNKNDEYKISFFENEVLAKRIEKNILKCPKLLPKYYGRKGSMLLFEWINGTELKHPISIKTCYKLGEHYGKIHKLNDLQKNHSSLTKIEENDEKFEKLIKENPRYFTKKEQEIITLKFKKAKKLLKGNLILEMNDANPHNFILNKKGKLYFVDEEALNHNIKGRGLIGFIKKFNNEQKRSFWKGYKVYHSNKYFSKEYEKIFEDYSEITSFIHRFNRYGKEHPKTKESHKKLKEMNMPFSK